MNTGVRPVTALLIIGVEAVIRFYRGNLVLLMFLSGAGSCKKKHGKIMNSKHEGDKGRNGEVLPGGSLPSYTTENCPLCTK